MANIIMVFDVESVGLYGQGFAAGYVVIKDDDKTILDQDYFACPSNEAFGTMANRDWIKENILPFLPPANCKTPEEVRDRFWARYQGWKNSPDLKKWGKDKFLLFADCGYPVETNFLNQCVVHNDLESDRQWDGPYPLQEIATVRTMLGLDPTLSYELPEDKRHNPVEECLYIAPLLVDWLNTLENMRSKHYVHS